MPKVLKNKTCVYFINSGIIMFTYDSIKFDIKWLQGFLIPKGAVVYSRFGPAFFIAQCFMRSCCVQTKFSNLLC